MTHGLRSDLWWTIPLRISYSEIDQIHLSSEAQCVSHHLPPVDCHTFLASSREGTFLAWWLLLPKIPVCTNPTVPPARPCTLNLIHTTTEEIIWQLRQLHLIQDMSVILKGNACFYGLLWACADYQLLIPAILHVLWSMHAWMWLHILILNNISCCT